MSTMSHAQAARLDRRIAAAQDFEGLCGLDMLPLAAWLALGGTGHFWPGAVVLIVGQMVARRYYRRRFGVVEREENPGQQVMVVLGVMVAIVALAALTPSTWHGVTLFPLLLTLCLGGMWWWTLRHVGLTWVHALALLAVGLLALLPGGDDSVQAWGGPVMGLALAVVGIHDHLRLVRIIGKGDVR